MSLYPTLGGKTCYDPLAYLDKAGEIPPDFLRRANSYTCPSGPRAGRGWLLITRRDYDALDTEGFLELKWNASDSDTINRASTYTPGGSAGEPIGIAKTAPYLSFQKMLVVKATALTPGNNVPYVPGSPTEGITGPDPDTMMLVEVADRRYLAEHFTTLNEQYNVRRFESVELEAADCYATSLNSAALWTWQLMLEDIWKNNVLESGPPDYNGSIWSVFAENDCPSIPAAALPAVPPENIRFIGVSAWDAFNSILSKLNCELVYNPFKDQAATPSLAWTIVELGSTQSGLSDFETSFFKPPYRLYSEETESPNIARIPETIRVYFHRWQASLTVNYQAFPIHFVDVATGVSEATPGSVLALYDDRQAVYNASDDIQNLAELEARAEELKDHILSDLQSVPDRAFYSGVSHIIPGSQVRSVTWRDYGGGSITEVHKRPHKFFPEKSGGMGISDSLAYESLLPPDIARKHLPISFELQFYSYSGLGLVTNDTTEAYYEEISSSEVKLLQTGNYLILFDGIIDTTNGGAAEAFVKMSTISPPLGNIIIMQYNFPSSAGSTDYAASGHAIRVVSSVPQYIKYSVTAPDTLTATNFTVIRLGDA